MNMPSVYAPLGLAQKLITTTRDLLITNATQIANNENCTVENWGETLYLMLKISGIALGITAATIFSVAMVNGGSLYRKKQLQEATGNVSNSDELLEAPREASSEFETTTPPWYKLNFHGADHETARMSRGGL